MLGLTSGSVTELLFDRVRTHGIFVSVKAADLIVWWILGQLRQAAFTMWATAQSSTEASKAKREREVLALFFYCA